jgi:hypothetical protein
MTDDKPMSDFSMKRTECPKCGAVWINGIHVWRGTGNMTQNSEVDLAGLVCNTLGDDTCINPSRGLAGGDTWTRRLEMLDKFEEEMDR